jgi:hypothetical protein
MLEGEDRAPHAFGEGGVPRREPREDRVAGCRADGVEDRADPFDGAFLEGGLGLRDDLRVQMLTDPERGFRRDRVGERDRVCNDLRPVGGRSERSAAAFATLSLDSRIAQISALSSSRMGRRRATSIAARRGQGSVPSPISASAFSPSRAMAEMWGLRISSASCMPRGIRSARLSSAPVNSPMMSEPASRGRSGRGPPWSGPGCLMGGRKLVDAG